MKILNLAERKAHRIADTETQSKRLKTAILATDDRNAAQTLSYICGYLASHAKYYEKLTGAQVLGILALELERATPRRANDETCFAETIAASAHGMRRGNHGT